MLCGPSLLLNDVSLGNTGPAYLAHNVALRNAAQADEVVALAPHRAYARCHSGKIAREADFTQVTLVVIFSYYDCLPPGLHQIRDSISIPVAATPGSRRRPLLYWVR